MSKAYLEYILDRLATSLPEHAITSRAMFGGYGIYLSGKIAAIIVDNQLYCKVNANNRQDYIDLSSQPFSYDKGDKKVEMSYWLLPEEIIEDDEALNIWFNKSYIISRDKK